MIPPPAAGGATVQRESFVYLFQHDHNETCGIGWTTDLSRPLGERTKRALTRAAGGRPQRVRG